MLSWSSRVCTNVFRFEKSPATFLRFRGLLLGDAKIVFVMAYVDDVVMLSQTFEEHLKHLSINHERMLDAGLTVKPGKV